MATMIVNEGRRLPEDCFSQSANYSLLASATSWTWHWSCGLLLLGLFLCVFTNYHQHPKSVCVYYLLPETGLGSDSELSGGSKQFFSSSDCTFGRWLRANKAYQHLVVLFLLFSFFFQFVQQLWSKDTPADIDLMLLWSRNNDDASLKSHNHSKSTLL